MARGGLDGIATSERILARRGPVRDGWVLAATILGSSLGFLEGSITNVALPAMQRALGADTPEMQWVVNAYMLAFGALILAGGAAGDRFGRRRVFGLGIAVFTVASTACGLAQGVPALLAARAVQGLGAALLVPGSLAILGAAFPPERRGRAIGTWSGVSAIVTAGGPILGGLLVDGVSWRAVFFVVVPVALAALAVTYRHVPESRAAGVAGPLDIPGAALATAGFGAVTFGLIEASPPAFAAGLLLLAGFLAVEARARAPLMPLGLFRSRTFAGTNLLTFLLYGALGAVLFFLPFDLVQVQDYSATATGAAFLPFALILGVLSRWSGGLRDRYGARGPLVLGPFVSALGFAGLAWPGIGGSYWTTFFPPMVVLGLGMAVTVAPLTTAVMSAHDESRAGVASGVNNAVARLASLIAVAVAGLLALAVFGKALERRVASLGVSADMARAMMAEAPRLAGARVPGGVAGPERAALERAVDEAFVEAFRWVAGLAAAMAAGSALAAARLIEPRR